MKGIKLANPEAPATRKQLWLLHILTGKDTRDLNITMQEASDRIAQLKGKSINRQSKGNNWHYCCLYGIPPSKHHWSNGKWHWKAFYITKSAKDANAQYDIAIKNLEQENRWNNIRAYALVKCERVAFARLLLIDNQRQSKYATVLKVEMKGE